MTQRRPRKHPTHREVYALKDEKGRVKIGHSNNALTRQAQLQTGNADTITLVHAERVIREQAPAVERQARKALREKHSGVREWTNDVSDQEAIDAIRTAHDRVRGKNDK